MKMQKYSVGDLGALGCGIGFVTPVSAQTTGASDEKPAYNLKLRDIEERVNDLKEKIFQSKARLIQLQEVVLHGTISGAKAKIVHRNEMGASFSLAVLSTHWMERQSSTGAIAARVNSRC